LKALVGDPNAEVMAECFAALLRLAPAPALDFLAGFLRAGSDEIAEAAAFALGESHLPAAFSLLRTAWDEIAQAERRRALLLAIGMLRIDDAVEFLLARVSEDSQRAASDAIAALGLYARDEAVRARLERCLEKKGGAALRCVFDREFRRTPS
jgi:hypothetical protein